MLRIWFAVVLLFVVAVGVVIAANLPYNTEEWSNLTNLKELTKMNSDMKGVQKAMNQGLMLGDAELKSVDNAIQNANDPLKASRAWGIAATGVAWAFKARTCVRYAYEEVKYWAAMKQVYEDIKDWFDNAGDVFRAYGDSVSGLFTNEGSFYTKIQNVANIHEMGKRIIDNMPKSLDYQLLRLENAYDTLVRSEFTYKLGPWESKINTTPGAIIPNTAGIAKLYDDYILDSKALKTTARFNRNLVDWANGEGWGARAISGRNETTPDGNPLSSFPGDGIRILDENISVPDDPFRPDRLVAITNIAVVTTAVAHSMAYRQWAQMALAKVNDLDAKLNEIVKNVEKKGGVNAREYAGAWYGIEAVNANNKMLRHSIQEAKVLQALLGTDVKSRSDNRYYELLTANAYNGGR